MGEPETALIHGTAEPGHAAHILRNGESPRTDALHKGSRQLQVGDSIHIHLRVKVAPQIRERLVTVVQVKHTGNAIKAEAVETELLQPPSKVTEQELQHLVLAVVKQTAIPVRVATVPLTGVEVLTVRAVKVIQPLRYIFNSVRVHHIQQHGEAHPVRRVDEVFEILRRTEAVAGGKERGNMVTEGAVVRVLLHSHDLHGVVTQRGYTRQHIVRKLPVAVNARLLTGHADVALVDERNLHRGGIPPRIPPLIGVLRFPDNTAVVVGLRILLCVADPSRDTIPMLVIRAEHMHLHPLTVPQGIRRQCHLPHPVPVPHHRGCRAVPTVEIADEMQLTRRRSPLPVDPLAALVAVETHPLVPPGTLLRRAVAPSQLRHARIIQTQPRLYLSLIRRQPPVGQHQTRYRRSSHIRPYLNPLPAPWQANSCCRGDFSGRVAHPDAAENGDNLPPDFAKNYSEHPSLARFSPQSHQ